MTRYGSDWLNPNVSDSALSAESNKNRNKSPVDFNEWDGTDNSHWPTVSDQRALAETAGRKRMVELGKRHYENWSRPIQWHEYRPPEPLVVDTFLPRDVIQWSPEVDSHQAPWARIVNIIEVDRMVSLQYEPLYINGSGVSTGVRDIVYYSGELVLGRRWIEPSQLTFGKG